MHNSKLCSNSCFIAKGGQPASFTAFVGRPIITRESNLLMLFDELGIYGGDVVEPVIVAAIVAAFPVLLIGDIGTNKTEGSKTIAQAVLRPTSQFRHYEVPALNFDDLVRFLNPKGLAKGTLEFVPTLLSIWQAEEAKKSDFSHSIWSRKEGISSLKNGGKCK